MFPFLLGLVVLVLDQLSKQWIRNVFYHGESRPVIEGIFNLVYVRNPGAAWGILGKQGAVLIVLSIAVLFLLIVYRRSFLADGIGHKIVFGLMLGGIVGNLVDRIRYGWVTDFLDFHIGARHWPAFNIADSAICIAVGLYLIIGFLHERKTRREERGK